MALGGRRNGQCKIMKSVLSNISAFVLPASAEELQSTEGQKRGRGHERPCLQDAVEAGRNSRLRNEGWNVC
jgi:hypothetical protein